MTDSAANKPEPMVVTRVFDAPCELVWKAWTDPLYAAQWWGPKDFTTPSYSMDFRVGGKFLFCMRSPDGQEFWTGGQYHEIIPHQKIVMSLYPTDPQGNQVDFASYGMGDHETIEGAHDVILFEDLGNAQTKVTLIGNEPMETAKESGQIEGWQQILDKFAAVLTTLA